MTTSDTRSARRGSAATMSSAAMNTSAAVRNCPAIMWASPRSSRYAATFGAALMTVSSSRIARLTSPAESRMPAYSARRSYSSGLLAITCHERCGSVVIPESGRVLVGVELDFVVLRESAEDLALFRRGLFLFVLADRPRQDRKFLRLLDDQVVGDSRLAGDDPGCE